MKKVLAHLLHSKQVEVIGWGRAKWLLLQQRFWKVLGVLLVRARKDSRVACCEQLMVSSWRRAENQPDASIPVPLLSPLMRPKGLFLDCCGTNICKGRHRAGVWGQRECKFGSCPDGVQVSLTRRHGENGPRGQWAIVKRQLLLSKHSLGASKRQGLCPYLRTQRWMSEDPAFTVWVHTLGRKPETLNSNDSVRRAVPEDHRGPSGGGRGFTERMPFVLV